MSDIYELTNNYRRQFGLDTLTPNQALAETAKNLAESMEFGQWFAHDTHKQRISAGYPDRGWTGQNIQWGPEEDKDALNVWIKSPEHNNNLKNPAYTDIGCGGSFRKTSGIRNVWVCNYGTAGVGDSNQGGITKPVTGRHPSPERIERYAKRIARWLQERS